MGRTFANRLAGPVAWLLLALAWWRVVEAGSVPSRTMVGTPFALALVAALVIGLWVRHVRAVYGRHGPRQRVPQLAIAYASDRLGRRLTVDGTPRSAPPWTEIRLLVLPGRKHYFRPS